MAVVTTAALPWFTGPSILSLWHAFGLACRGHRVRYVVPWLSPRSQRRLFGTVRFADRNAYANHLAQEGRQRVGCADVEVAFYRAAYLRAIQSIIPLQDPLAPALPADALLLEEPEHLGWLPRPMTVRASARPRTLGIVHTNYGGYARDHAPLLSRWMETAVNSFNSRCLRRLCTRAVPLSDAAHGALASALVVRARVSGVAPHYCRVPPVGPDTRGVYFLGRITSEKRVADAVELARAAGLAIDLFGTGPACSAVSRYACDIGAAVRFMGQVEQPWSILAPYRLFINPSLSEVLCTATAEALCAGRHVVMPRCAANDAFEGLANAHFYDDRAGALSSIATAMKQDPEPPTAARAAFDWSAALGTIEGHLGLPDRR